MADTVILLCGADSALEAAVVHHLHDEPGWQVVTTAQVRPAIQLLTPATLSEATARDCPSVLLAESFDPQTLEYALRLGVSGVIRVPDELGALRSTIWRALGRVSGSEGTSDQGRIIALCSLKGGSGTSLVATNLAVALQQAGARTLLVDLNPTADAACILLGLNPRRCWLHLLPVAAELKPQHVESVACRLDPPGLTVLASPAAVVGIDPEVPSLFPAELPSLENLRTLLGALQRQYTHIILDCPTGLSTVTQNALQSATHVFYVITPDTLSLPPLGTFSAAMRQISGLPERQVQLLVNRFSSDSEVQANDLAALTGMEVGATVASDYRNLHSFINRGKSPLLSGGGAFVRDIRRLAGLFADEAVKGGDDRGHSGGWIQQLRLSRAKDPAKGTSR